MIKNKNLIYGTMAFLLLAVLSIFIWNNYQIQVQERPNKPIKLPPQISGKCGIENCNGLDITCGPNVPDGCPAIYAAGDNCRQYANCRVVNGQCRLEKTSKFDSCKSCVEKCEQDYKNDPDNVLECESKCAE